MVLQVWCFECQRCKRGRLLCTRCLRRRRYCAACGPQKRRAQMREAGREYQRTDKGRRSHRQRNRRYRRGLRERRHRGGRAEARCAGAPAPASAPTSTPATSELARPPETEAPQPPRVTHQSRGPESRQRARVDSALTAAASWVAGMHGAGEPTDAEPGAEQMVARALGAGATREPAWSGAAEAAQWPCPGEARGPVLARCWCCGRTGELVFFDGRLAVVRGRDPG